MQKWMDFVLPKRDNLLKETSDARKLLEKTQEEVKKYGSPSALDARANELGKLVEEKESTLGKVQGSLFGTKYVLDKVNKSIKTAN